MRLPGVSRAAKETAGDVDDEVGPVERIGIRADVKFGTRYEPVRVDLCHAFEANGT
ncbi:MAG: hypothetical protein RL430_1028 [Actinomycetota bacterium]